MNIDHRSNSAGCIAFENESDVAVTMVRTIPRKCASEEKSVLRRHEEHRVETLGTRQWTKQGPLEIGKVDLVVSGDSTEKSLRIACDTLNHVTLEADWRSSSVIKLRVEVSPRVKIRRSTRTSMREPGGGAMSSSIAIDPIEGLPAMTLANFAYKEGF